MLGRGANHVLSDGRRAGEQQMVEWQRHEGAPDIGVAVDHREERGIEMPGHQSREQLSRGRGGLGHLHEDPVSRRERGDDGPDGEIERIVPRHDDAHDTEGLEDDARSSWKEPYAGGARLWLHPALDVAARMWNG